MNHLTRKQVLALSRALKRKGHKLPKLGHCTILGWTRERPRVNTPQGEVCHHLSNGRHVYTHHGGAGAANRMMRSTRRSTR